jgi:hypothetical protein
MIRQQLAYIFGVMLLFSSCFKEDEAIAPFDRGDRQTATIALGNDYRYQVYFDLNQGLEVSSNNKLDYDLAFESSPLGCRILLNTSTFMRIARTNLTNFESVNSAAGLVFQFDPSSGNLDSTAVGNWFTINGNDTIFDQHVYVIDRGYDQLGRPLGHKKIVFEQIKKDEYSFRYANLNGTDERQGRVKKEAGYNFVYYAFDPQRNTRLLEPNREHYTLLFTQYTTLLFTNDGTPYPYLVTGTLINRHNTYVAIDKAHTFEEIDMDFAEQLPFSNKLDFIGYNWKDLTGDVESGNVLYQVRSDYNYIIRDFQGFYYKMRFVGFYNQEGERGFPVIEFQRL